MTKFARILTATAAVAAGFTAAPALAVPVGATPTQAIASAQIVQPLKLKWNQNMDFGTILLSGIVAGSTYTVSLSSSGTLTCSTGLTCSATGKQAIFNVQGSNNQVVKIYTASSTLSSGSGPGAPTLTLTPSAQASVTLTNSGAPGTDFNVGASFPITSLTVEGIYSGNLNVTVDYN